MIFYLISGANVYFVVTYVTFKVMPNIALNDLGDLWELSFPGGGA